MKKLILGDLHWQRPTYNYVIDKALKRVFLEQVWPFVKKYNIREVTQLGDFTNDTKQINKQTAQLIHEAFTKPAIDMELLVRLICGNHDAYFRDRNEINGLRTLFTNTPFKIIDTEVLLSGKSAYIPWGFNPKNYKAKYAFGHLKITGFEYQKGVVNKSGNEPQDFDFFDFVYAGHFHRKSIKKNMMYVGSIIALDFGEVDTEHGFGVFDDETGEFEFIKTEIEVFKKIIYQNGADIANQTFTDKVISIIVLENEDKLKYNNFLETIYSQHPIDVKILSVESELKNVIELENVEAVENILSLSKKYIEKLELAHPMDVKTLYEIFERTHREAVANG